MSEQDNDRFILEQMPSFIAINYQRLLSVSSPQDQVALALKIYDLGLRSITLNLITQYLIRDEHVFEVVLNQILQEKLSTLTIDACRDVFFATLRAYEGHRDLLFIKELYDFYWDSSTTPHKRRIAQESAFNQLTHLSVRWALNERPKSMNDWHSLVTESKQLLDQVLNSLSFMSEYDLIRISQVLPQEYAFELYKGCKVQFNQSANPKNTSLKPGEVYLRSRYDEFLRLDPFVIFDENNLDGSEISHDLGVYTRSFINYKKIQYLFTILGLKELDSISSFTYAWRKIFDAINQKTTNLIEADQLSWLQVCTICEDITKHRITSMSRKYDRQVYLQRESVYEEFRKFLISDKRCFVLIGKSGVGKSNFLLSLYDTLLAGNANICTLIYDASQISMDITDTISQDFEKRRKFVGTQRLNIWDEIRHMDGINDHQVILFIDAINENAEPAKLLKSLDNLVQSPWNWLKIVISCRPETWKTIKKGIYLAEDFYYRRNDMDLPGIELEQLSYSDQLDDFLPYELFQAYGKYQKRYNLQTPYAAIPYHLREILREPLNLWLVANTYTSIPSNLKVTELVERYIHNLEQTGRLQLESIRLLKKQIVPLMVSESAFYNALTPDLIEQAGEALYYQVYSTEINQPFQALLDIGILARFDDGREQKIAFKYERFYEYFVGQRITEIAATQADRHDFFCKMIGHIQEQPFLWGAVRSALLNEAIHNAPDTIIKLCFTNQQRTKELLVSILIELGKENTEKLEAIIKQLLPPQQEPGVLKRIRQIQGKGALSITAEARTAGRIAAEVASALNIPWVLYTIGIQSDSTLRIVAIRQIYHLWEKDHESGFKLLDSLVKQALPGIIPNVYAFDTVFGLSLIIFFQAYHQKDIMNQLQDNWRWIIEKIFRIHTQENIVARKARSLVRDNLFQLATTVVLRIISEFPQLPVDFKKLEETFKLPPANKALYKRIVQYMDTEGDYSHEQMRADLIQALSINDLFFEIAINTVLVAHSLKDPVGFFPFLKDYFDASFANPDPTPFVNAILNALPGIVDDGDIVRTLLNSTNVVYDHHIPDEVFEFLIRALEMVRARQEENNKMQDPRFFGPYLFHYYQRFDNMESDFLKSQITKAYINKDNIFFNWTITSELSLYGIDFKRPAIALAVLKLFLEEHSLTKKGERDQNRFMSMISEEIATFLARMRISFPDDVDAFLQEYHLPEEFQLQVRISEPVENVGQLIGMRIWWFIRDEVIAGSPALRNTFIRILSNVVEHKNLKSWVVYLGSEIVNLIYGSAVLKDANEHLR
jgi:hypothetical protein